jgi:hypothetical protein
VWHYLWRAVDQDGVVLDILFNHGGMPTPPNASSGCRWRALNMSLA